jgi:hypothetical protein
MERIARSYAMSLLGAACFISVFLPHRPQAQPAPAAIVQHALEPQVVDTLKRMGATLAAAPSIAVRMTGQREGRLENGQTVLLSITSAVLARKPDKLSVIVGSDLGNFALWYDGQSMTILNLVENVYAATPLAGPLDNAVTWIERRMAIEIPVRPLLSSDPYAAMFEGGSTTGVQLGRSLIGETEVDHFAFRNPDTDWEIWIEANERALPRRISLVDRQSSPPARVTVDFDDWALGTVLPDAAFTFAAPAGAVTATLLLKPE